MRYCTLIYYTTLICTIVNPQFAILHEKFYDTTEGDVYSMDTGFRIKERRELLGLTLTEVAEFVGVNRTTVMRYEKGDTKKMPITLITPFARILKCSEEYLMCWTNNPEPIRREENNE